jgi:hypothetical protein
MSINKFQNVWLVCFRNMVSYSFHHKWNLFLTPPPSPPPSFSHNTSVLLLCCKSKYASSDFPSTFHLSVHSLPLLHSSSRQTLLRGTICFTDLDQGRETIFFQSILTTFIVSVGFKGHWGISKN